MPALSSDFPTTPVPFNASAAELDLLTRQLRFKLVQMSHAAGTPHLASALSCVEILVAAYWRVLRIDPANPAEPGRDRFILSKGHAASVLYAALAARGYFPPAMLDGFGQHGSPLAEQPAPGCAPGWNWPLVRWATACLLASVWHSPPASSSGIIVSS